MPTDLEKYEDALRGGITVYPDGYGEWDTFYPLDRLLQRHAKQQGAPCEPETLRRMTAYLIYKQGFVGIGDSWRPFGSNTSAASLANRSFHQDQIFEGGKVYFCAFDLVVVGGFTEAGELITRAPTKEEVADSVLFGLHDMGTDESWHTGPVEIRGHQGWVNRGRQLPVPGFRFPDGSVTPPPIITPPVEPPITPPVEPPVAPPINPPSIFPEGTHMINVNVSTLKKGSTGRRVEKLQAILNANFTEFKKDYLTVDGQFGPKTEQKVKDVQMFFHPLAGPVDGICGPKTWNVVISFPTD